MIFLIALVTTININIKTFNISNQHDFYNVVSRSIFQTLCETEKKNCKEFCYTVLLDTDYKYFENEYTYCPAYLND